jgi:hypothetical protein
MYICIWPNRIREDLYYGEMIHVPY